MLYRYMVLAALVAGLAPSPQAFATETPAQGPQAATASARQTEEALTGDLQADTLHKGGLTVAGKAFLRQMQERDSILIADQVFYGFKLEGVKEGTRFMLPDLSDGICEGGVDILTPWIVDTLKVRRAKKDRPRTYDIEGGVLLASFEEGTYYLAPISLLRISEDGTRDTLVFAPQRLEVKTIPIDMESYTPHDIKGQVRYPLTLSEVLPWLAGIQLLAMLVVAIYCLIRIYRRKDGLLPTKKEPAHIVALRKLDRYRGDKMWAPEKQKAFYSGITDALREYISSRYGISAMEMTTAEIFKDMKQTDAPEPLVAEVRELFERADFVKFAKFVASEQENASALPVAVRFVTETYQADIEAEGAEPSEGDKNK